MLKNVIRKRIAALRTLMQQYNLAAYYVPGTDPHMNEYIPAHWQRREWISGFTGSNGDAVITRELAGLWTDGRYFLQAEAELKDTGISLYKLGVKEEVTVTGWLGKSLRRGEVAGVDPKLLSCQKAHELSEELEKREVGIYWLEENLIDRLWTDRPPLPERPFVTHPLEYAGESVREKLERVRTKMREEGAQVYIINKLDALAWLFNIRGRDIEYNPVVIAYAVITLETAILFVRSQVLTAATLKYLQPLAEVKAYTEFKDQLLARVCSESQVWLDPAATNYWIEMLIKDKCKILYKDDPVIRLKAAKNKTEIAGFKQAHLRDGVAMVRFLYWLEHNLDKAGSTEITIQERLLQFRSEQALFQFPSFSTIAAYGEHGAIIHYSPSPATNVSLQKTGLLLVDSGGQYLDGTTDITRTVSLGRPTREEQEYYTYVLKGYIQLATTSFPDGTKGIQLDVLARKFLWDRGADYGHGTGHGVGSFLNVHEGPQAISASARKQVPLEEGMFVSLEPGYYRAGKFGIRLENLAVVVKNEKLSCSEQNYFSFETVTLCPFARELILVELLTAEERAYLDQYHQNVYTRLLSYLPAAEAAWLKKATQPL